MENWAAQPHQEFPGVFPRLSDKLNPVLSGQAETAFPNYPVSFVYTSSQTCQIQKTHYIERLHKDTISENRFTGERVDGKPIHVKSTGFQKYLDSCGRDQLTSGTNHSQSVNA